MDPKCLVVSFFPCNFLKLIGWIWLFQLGFTISILVLFLNICHDGIYFIDGISIEAVCDYLLDCDVPENRTI